MYKCPECGEISTSILWDESTAIAYGGKIESITDDRTSSLYVCPVAGCLVDGAYVAYVASIG